MMTASLSRTGRRLPLGRIACLFLGCAGMLAAQQPPSVNGPTSGLVYDQTAGVLRPVLGLPGGATLGNGIPLSYSANWIVVSPRLDSAVVAAQDGSLHFLSLSASGMVEVPVPGITVVPQHVVYSPSGTAAALLYAAQAQVVTGLPSAPVPGKVLPLDVPPDTHVPLAARPQPGQVALSDDGSVLLEARGGTVRLAGAGGRSSLMNGMLAAFAPGGHDAAVADGAGVTLVRSVDGAAQRTVLADSGVPQPVGLAFSADGTAVYAAVASGVVALATAGGTPNQVACSCAPSEIAPMGAVFRLNELGQGPLWLLDPGNASPRTVFVPALQ
jgi:hypothetical protein